MDTVGNCFNLLILISTVVIEIHNLCENAKENKDKYEKINERVTITSNQLKKTYENLLKDGKNLNETPFVDNLQRYLNKTIEIRDLTKKYNKMRKNRFLEFIGAKKYNDKIKAMEMKYEGALGDLDFAINLENYSMIGNLRDEVHIVQEVSK